MMVLGIFPYIFRPNWEALFKGYLSLTTARSTMNVVVQLCIEPGGLCRSGRFAWHDSCQVLRVDFSSHVLEIMAEYAYLSHIQRASLTNERARYIAPRAQCG